MRFFISFLSVSLVSTIGFAAIEVRAQDGQACQAILKKGNDLNAQISAVRKKANDEEECNAEAALWAQAVDLVDQRIALEKQSKTICAGFTVTGGITIEELTERATKLRSYEAKAKDGCDAPPPPTPPVKAQNNDTGLIVSGTIPCFGGGDCKSQNKPAPPAASGPPQPMPKGTQSTITGDKFGDKRPPEGSGGVITAK
jgi:hypothetical protein